MCLSTHKLKTVTAFLLLFLLLSCDKKIENVVYEEPILRKQDATFTWLDDSANYEKANYMPVFYDYYQKTLNEDNLEKAALLLDRICNIKSRNVSFDEKFVTTLNYFASHYMPKLPPEKTMFVNSYFSELYIEKGDFKTAISYSLKNTKIPVTDHDTCREAAYAYSNIAFCYHSTGNQNLAIKYNMEALDYFNKIQHIDGMGSVYSSMGMIYKSLENYTEAEKYIDKSIDCSKKSNDLVNLFIDLENKIILYGESRNNKRDALVIETYKYFNKSGLESKDRKVAIYSHYIELLVRQNKLTEAKKIIDELEPIVAEIDSVWVSEAFEAVVADYKIQNNEPIDVKTLQEDVIPYLIENENYKKLLVYYTVIKLDALKKNDYKTALEYEEMIARVEIDLGNNINSNKVIELDKKYQNAVKEQQIVTQEKTIAKKNTTIAWLAFVLLAVVVLIIVYQSRLKQKKLKLEKQSAQAYTKQLLEKTEEERKRIASDLHDSVSHELLSLKNLFEEKSSVTNTKIDAIINDIRIISRNLHPVMFDKIGLQESIRQLVDRVQSVNNFMITAEMDYTFDLSSSVELQIYRIVQESISNVIKYANAVASKITIWESKNKIHIEIKDNGQGFDVEETLNNSAAFGLHNIIERSRAIGGEARIVSDQNGTVITIEINK